MLCCLTASNLQSIRTQDKERAIDRKEEKLLLLATAIIGLSFIITLIGAALIIANLAPFGCVLLGIGGVSFLLAFCYFLYNFYSFLGLKEEKLNLQKQKEALQLQKEILDKKEEDVEDLRLLLTESSNRILSTLNSRFPLYSLNEDLEAEELAEFEELEKIFSDK